MGKRYLKYDYLEDAAIVSPIYQYLSRINKLINYASQAIVQASLFYSSLSKSSNTVNKLLTEDISRQIGQTKKHFMNNKKRL